MAMETGSEQHGPEDGCPLDRRGQLLEVLVFLFLIVPSMVLSLVALQGEKATFGFVAWAVILRDLALVCLILFFLWRNNEARARIGLTFKHGWREIVIGLLLFAPFFFFAGLVESFLRGVGFSVPSKPVTFLTPHGTSDFVLAFFLVVVVAITEETMFRGYLITRFSAVTQSTTSSLLLSAILFSIGHGYEGSAGVITVGVMGLIFGLVFVWRKSLVAPITMHFLQDFIGVVLAPLMVGR